MVVGEQSLRMVLCSAAGEGAAVPKLRTKSFSTTKFLLRQMLQDHLELLRSAALIQSLRDASMFVHGA